MNSLYSLFGTTRKVLKAAGPDVGASGDSVADFSRYVEKRTKNLTP